MCSWLAWTAVHLAWLVQHVLECILGLHWPLRLCIWLHLPTASCSPLFLLIMDSGHLPTAILSIWLLILPLSTILLVIAPIDISALSPTEPLVSCLCRLRSPLCLNHTADAELNRLAHCGVRDSKRIGHLPELG